MTEVRRQPALGRTRRIHMVGIGGIGMSSIAEVLLSRGFAVSGSDLVAGETTDHLKALGAAIYLGHDAGNVADADVVVHSSAVDVSTNAETVEAARRRIPIITRADMLGELMRTKYGVAVAGTHGKTTTTTMAGLVVTSGGFDPTIIVGGRVAVFGSNAVAGEGDLIVIEADEYDRAFLRLTPTIAVETSIEAEHLDIYEDLEDIKRSFVQFANAIPFFGSAIVCIDDENVRWLAGQLERRVVTYGISDQANVRATDLKTSGMRISFGVSVDGESACEIRLAVPGIHNVRNALAAFCVGLELDIPIDTIASALESFEGVQRRFDVLSSSGDVTVVDDYAHHPTEVAATLNAAADVWPERRIVAVFQPHLYSRTRDLAADFAQVLLKADVILVTEIYGARERPIEGITGRRLVDLAQDAGHVDATFVGSAADVPDVVLGRLDEGDVVVLMGAGDIWRQSRRLAAALKDRKRTTT